ncbi:MULTISPECIES: ANTAR domain-containing protein [unclassified Streptomyces]|uniref:ANTAR domain-containing protein n=1 Tax=unclassified Streptomyces TaxID=2593676 RepID=UPI0033BE63F7
MSAGTRPGENAVDAADGPAALQEQAAGRQQEATTQEAVIDQATGIVMALGRLNADQARDILTEVARRAGIGPRRLAGLLTDWASTGELNLGVRIALEEAVRGHSTGPHRP